MPIELEDVLKANVVLLGVALLGEQHQRDKFAGLVGTEIISETLISSEMLISGAVPLRPTIGSPTNVAETGLVLNLHRDRIQLISAPSRTSIERQYPTFDDLERLAEVGGYAIDLTDLRGQTPIVFGFNIEAVYRQTEETPSERYLAERLFSHRRFGIEEWSLVGGGGKLSFEGNDGRWTFTVEPRGNDPSGRRVYLSLNLHRDRQQAPNREGILISLQEMWRRSQDFATQLDASA